MYHRAEAGTLSVCAQSMVPLVDADTGTSPSSVGRSQDDACAAWCEAVPETLQADVMAVSSHTKLTLFLQNESVSSLANDVPPM